MERTILFAIVAAAVALGAPASAERLYLHYEGDAWGFVPLGDAALDVSVRADAYRVGATLQSGGLLRLFDQTQIAAKAEGGVTTSGPVWTRYDLDHNYARKHRVTAMRVGEGGVESDVTPRYMRLGEPPASDAQKRAARDPLSSIVAMGMTIARTHRCAGVFPTFDGRFLYDLSFSGGKEGRYRTDGYDGPVVRCIVTYTPVAGYDPRNARESRRKTPHAEMWFALTDNPNFAPPVRMILPLGIGDANLTLTQWRRADVLVDDEAGVAPAPGAAPGEPSSTPAAPHPSPPSPTPSSAPAPARAP
jgi:hypothetical protein